MMCKKTSPQLIIDARQAEVKLCPTFYSKSMAFNALPMTGLLHMFWFTRRSFALDNSSSSNEHSHFFLCVSFIDKEISYFIQLSCCGYETPADTYGGDNSTDIPASCYDDSGSIHTVSRRLPIRLSQNKNNFICCTYTFDGNSDVITFIVYIARL